MSVLDVLRGGLIVSVQAEAQSPANTPTVIAALASAALRSGAVGVRIEGVERIAAVRARTDAPIIGLMKATTPGFEPYITASLELVGRALDAGATIVAFDATDRPRPDGSTIAAAIDRIHAAGGLAMADCATLADAESAAAAGADIVASTLCGYTASTRGAPLPALDLVRAMSSLGPFCVAEGGIGSPRQLQAALLHGADAVVVGTAITNVDALTRSFAAACKT